MKTNQIQNTYIDFTDFQSPEFSENPNYKKDYRTSIFNEGHGEI